MSDLILDAIALKLQDVKITFVKYLELKQLTLDTDKLDDSIREGIESEIKIFETSINYINEIVEVITDDCYPEIGFHTPIEKV